MRHCVLVFTVVLVGAVAPPRGTTVRGEVGGQTWTLAGSPYTVSGDLTVASGKRLTIEPGVQVIFGGYYKVDIRGALTARGTPAQRIVFTAADKAKGWGGLRWCNVDNQCTADDVDNYVEWTEISYGTVTGEGAGFAYYGNRGGCVYVANFKDGAKFHFNDNYVHHCRAGTPTNMQHGGAFFWAGSRNLVLQNNVWEANFAIGEGGAICIVHSPAVRIVGGAFKNNRAQKPGGAVRVFDGDVIVEKVELEGNQPNDFTAGVKVVP